MPKVGMPEIRKPQLIEATMRTINEVGLLKANVATIARHAGVSPAIINHYFGGKDGLLEATMRTLLKKLSFAVTSRLQSVESDDPLVRISAVIEGMFDAEQTDPKAVKTWLAFWSESMHRKDLHRLQRVNQRRLLSYLRFELKKLLPADHAMDVAENLAALIDGLWLRGALSPEGIDQKRAHYLISEYLRYRLSGVEGQREPEPTFIH